MHTFVWVVQGVLAVVFLGAGLTKLVYSQDRLMTIRQMAWTEDFAPAVLKLIGLAEVLAAIGLILPMALDVAPGLTPWAAVGLAVVMAGAAFTHLRRKEYQPLVAALALLTFAVIVAAYRF